PRSQPPTAGFLPVLGLRRRESATSRGGRGDPAAANRRGARVAPTSWQESDAGERRGPDRAAAAAHPSRRQQDLSPTAPRTAPNRRQQDSSRSLACAVGNLPRVVVIVAVPRPRPGVARACHPLRGRNRTRENVGDPTEPRPPAHPLPPTAGLLPAR